MGRSLGLVLALVAVLVGTALLDGDRERSPLEASLGGAMTEPASEPLETTGDASFGGSGLVDCVSDLGVPSASVPPSPPLTPRGVETIADRVERLRRLRFAGPVDVTFLDRAGIDRRISALIDQGADPDLVRSQGEILELLGAIPPGSDLLELTTQALDSQVLGLFVPETQELLVSKSGDAGVIEAITLAHELEHALAYDALGLPVQTEARRGRGDRDLAGLALVEGDATLTMQAYALRYVDAADQLSLLGDPALSSGQGQLEKLPYILQAQLIFPYDAGLAYVCERFSKGGWAAVDRAYADPPRSTAELLDPAAGPIRPADPEPIPPLPAPWDRAYADQIGAAELSWLYEAPGDDPGLALPDAAGTAADWRGGAIELWTDGPRRALGVSLAQRAGGQLCPATIAWYGAARPAASLSRDGSLTLFVEPDQAAAISCTETGMGLGIGPDPAAARRLAAG